MLLKHIESIQKRLYSINEALVASGRFKKFVSRRFQECEILFVALFAVVELSLWLTLLIQMMCKYFWLEIKNTDDRIMRQGSSTNEPG